MLTKIIWANFQRKMELFTQKIVTKLSKIWIWDPRSGILDPRSGIRRKPIPDPGVKKAPDPGSGSATLLAMPGFVKQIRENFISSYYQYIQYLQHRIPVTSNDARKFLYAYMQKSLNITFV
jgi:hypothetical protein